MQKKQLWAILLLVFALAACTGGKKAGSSLYEKSSKSPEEISKIFNKFDRLKSQLAGHFSNRQQLLEENSAEPPQEFVVVPIFQYDRPGEFWVYLELFSPDMKESPLDQRIEQYVQIDRDSFRQEVYYLKEPEKYINAWKKSKFPKLDIRKDLIKNPACDLTIIHQEHKKGSFKTLMPDEVTCEMLTSTTAARYVDLMYEITDEGYTMWFTFYDKSKQKLKATEGPGLSFLRLNPGDEGYIKIGKN